MEVGLTSSNVQFPTKVEARVTEILNRILGTPVELQAQLLQYVQDASITFIVTLSIWCRVFCVCEYFKIKIIYKDCP